MQYTLEFSDLSSAQTGAHFHYGAVGVQGSLIESLPLRSPASGSWTMSAEVYGWLTNGEMYINVHTLNHVGGEIRVGYDCEQECCEETPPTTIANSLIL